MSPHFHRAFLRMRHKNGASISICMRCLIVIGTEGAETQQEEAEIAHACPGFSLTRILHPEIYVRHCETSTAHEMQ